MGEKKKGVSRHGTLGEADMDGAVAVNVNEVLKHCQSNTTSELFGRAGGLPPKKAQVFEPRYTIYHEFKDEKAGLDWLGLNKVTNEKLGKQEPVQLSPGEYKLELKLSKQLNKNFLHDLSGLMVGNLSSLTVQDGEERDQIISRGLPNAYLDVNFSVQAKKYSLFSSKGVLDLGVNSAFSRVFVVPENSNGVQLELSLYSHSVLKRLKVEGRLWRRDFTPEEPQAEAARAKRAVQVGKQILAKALSNEQPPKPVRRRQRLDSDVDLEQVVHAFYSDVAPDRLANLSAVFKHFADRDDDLINTLEAKYKVAFDSRGVYQQKVR